MTFRRSTSGLNNLCLFYRVDAVVYLEGGNSLTREEVENGVFSASTDDIRYWQALFGFYRPDKNFKFCSVGSKETAKSIAEDIVQGRVHNIIVAMDRDFDGINGRMISNTNVIYTFGYSWENDAWAPASVLEAYCLMSGSCRTGMQSQKELVEKFFTNCSHQLWGAVRIDAVLSQHGNSLFRRNSYMRYIDVARSGYPRVNRQEIRHSLKGARELIGKPLVRRSNFDTSPLIDCYGHLLAEFAYRILKYLLENVSRLPKIPKSYAISVVVEKFAQLLRDGYFPELRDHYDAEFARVLP
jgi:Protein of unknown function (DUF4435)